MVRRVAHDLIVHDESKISEVVPRRLFKDLAGLAYKIVAKTYAAANCRDILLIEMMTDG